MSAFAISTNSIGKRYRVGSKVERHDQLRFAIASAFKAPLRNFREIWGLDRAARDERNTVWALRDVSFRVREGEVVGIIGRNGAGKSTLLKILARITWPTTGSAEVQGRVGSLLEVGTGFHPELTGRENVYLNGSVLGMHRREIDRKFDEIVEFSGVERFLDTPVKRYSSGMYLRLAFSVAAHLQSEILLVDEVLAVGDAEFQKKCLGKMEDLSGHGRTVLFVSHNIGAVTRLCRRALWLDAGRVKMDGPAAEVADAYLMHMTSSALSWRNPAPGSTASVRAASIRQDGEGDSLRFDRPLDIAVDVALNEAIHDLAILVRVTDALGNVILTSWDSDRSMQRGALRSRGAYKAVCTVPGALLRPGHYTLTVGLHVPGGAVLDMQENVLAFEVSSMGYPLNASRVGLIAPVLHWAVERKDHAPPHQESGGVDRQ
jgi:lipopolysaccharide transport system ATP-binding protein